MPSKIGRNNTNDKETKTEKENALPKEEIRKRNGDASKIANPR
jgi:hypothetical protein